MKDKEKIIFFDNDGVLVDTESIFYAANCVMLKEYGVELDEHTFAEMSMTKGMSLADIIVSLGKTPEEAEDARQRRNLVYDAMLKERAESLVIPGVLSALAALHKKYRICVVTCCQTMHFRTIHANSGLRQYFDDVVGDDDFVRHKPHPEPYLTAIRRTGLTALSLGYAVEDSERGVQSALAAGLNVAAIPCGISRYGNFSAATRRFENITAFAEMMLKR